MNIRRGCKFYADGLHLASEAPLKTEHQQLIKYGIGLGSLGIGCSHHWKLSNKGLVGGCEGEGFDVLVETLCANQGEFLKETIVAMMIDGR